jgi:hypothetical protein
MEAADMDVAVEVGVRVRASVWVMYVCACVFERVGE